MLSHRPPIWRHLLHHVLPSLLVNGVAPFVVYTLLHPHMSQLHALMVAALVPLADSVVGLVRQRRINAFGALVFLSLVLSSLLVLVGGSPRLILVRESALSGVFGVLMLLSLFWPQPLVYYLARHFVAPGASAGWHAFQRTASAPRFRSFLRLLTVIWGLVTVLDAALNTYLAFHLPVGTFLAVTPLARYSMMGCTFAWTLAHAHRGRYLAQVFAAGVAAADAPGKVLTAA
jgi:hypothetical protein